MNPYAKLATVGFRFLAILTVIGGLPTLITGTALFALASTVVGTALYVSSRPLGTAIARDLE